MEPLAITRGTMVSVVIDAMAMTAQHSEPTSRQEVRKSLS
jgi:hypothetical protein